MFCSIFSWNELLTNPWLGLWFIILLLSSIWHHQRDLISDNTAVADPGGGSGGSGPPLWDLTLTTLRLKLLHRQDHVSLFNWLIFLMKQAWHFPTKVNARDIQKCNCFWVPSYDLFASARKAVFPAQTATGVHSSGDNHVFSTSQIQWNWKWNS